MCVRVGWLQSDGVHVCMRVGVCVCVGPGAAQATWQLREALEVLLRRQP
jgi:hypothetical protein